MVDNSKPTGLDWVRLQTDMNEGVQFETSWEKLIRKFKENPLVPIGCATTVCALTYGLRMFLKGEKHMQQKMMRLRIGAQLFTVAAAVGGIVYSLPQGKRTYEELKKRGERKM